MDERTFRIVLAVLACGFGAVLLQPLLHLDIPPGFWTLLGAVLTYLGARAAMKGKEQDGE